METLGGSVQTIDCGAAQLMPFARGSNEQGAQGKKVSTDFHMRTLDFP